jgi:hypothetical protein
MTVCFSRGNFRHAQSHFIREVFSQRSKQVAKTQSGCMFLDLSQAQALFDNVCTNNQHKKKHGFEGVIRRWQKAESMSSSVHYVAACGPNISHLCVLCPTSRDGDLYHFLSVLCRVLFMHTLRVFCDGDQNNCHLDWEKKTCTVRPFWLFDRLQCSARMAIIMSWPRRERIYHCHSCTHSRRQTDTDSLLGNSPLEKRAEHSARKRAKDSAFFP